MKAMKRFLSVSMSMVLVFALAVAVPPAQSAAAAEKEITSGDYTYVKETKNGSAYAKVMRYTGSEEDLVLPDELGGLPVRSLGYYFADNSSPGIRSLVLPKSFDIRFDIDYPLSRMYSLERIQVAEGNERFEAEDGVLYNVGKTEMIAYPRARAAAEYVVPSSVKEFTIRGFSEVKFLKKITLPKGITDLPDFCSSGLEAISIPDSVTYIDELTFESCESLKSIKFGKGIKWIGDSAFFGCSSLKKITLPKGLRTITDGTFVGTGIKKVKIPDTVVYISRNAFDSGVKLEKQSYLKKVKYKSDSGYCYYKYRAYGTVKNGKKTKRYSATRIAKIKPAAKKLTVKKGKKVKTRLRIYYAPSGYDAYKGKGKLKKGYLEPDILKFSSSNEKVATVSKYGNVKGHKKGTATITVKLRVKAGDADSALTATRSCKVKVVVK